MSCPWSVLCVWAAVGDAHPSLPNERHLCVVKCIIPVWPVGPVWRGFQHDNKTAAKLWHRPICSPQLVNIHPQSLTINKGQRGRERVLLNAWLRRWGGKQPVTMATSPASHPPAGCERGGRRAFLFLFFFFFFFFVGFSWKDISRSVLRRGR